MSVQLPEIHKITTIEAINWYTKQVAEITKQKNRIAGIYALLLWKGELNRKALAERNSL